MTQNIESMQAAPKGVLRLLNGALRGGEFMLEQGVTLIVARSPQALQHGAGQAEFPDNAIFVPVDDEGGNFEVEISADEAGVTAIALRDLNVSGAADETAYMPNRRFPPRCARRRRAISASGRAHRALRQAALLR